ncbi:hypothetical protein [Pedobacter caeni]|uniref:Uncharacterized protein n=1 Tax=Pedobacter caeni TaxID=288992 RepID=A0A1M5HKT9_9SPHI|nr:hypothetical protein [Pedobacter caeni]SHG16573.1 hypothetical protein SAMN04488522_104705 [Pedobacter caeni]
MVRLKIMTALTSNPYFWLVSFVLIATVLFVVLIAYFLKIIHEPCEE